MVLTEQQAIVAVATIITSQPQIDQRLKAAVQQLSLLTSQMSANANAAIALTPAAIIPQLGPTGAAIYAGWVSSHATEKASLSAFISAMTTALASIPDMPQSS